MDNSQLLAKVNTPTWLKILVISLIGLGIFFRFAHLGQKLYWGDEAFTSLAISGHTLAEVKQEVFNHQDAIPVTILDKYQHIDPERNVADTVNYLMTSDPQHPPLYYVIVRLWAQVFGDSPAVVRSLSALFSILIFPSVYWLCLELFESPIVGWVAMALIAVSPLQVFFAEEARQYSLWMVTILLSSAALLRAIRLESFASWAFYSFTLALGFYTHLFTVLVAIAHGIYVLVRQQFCFTKTSINYLLGSITACLMFLPWLIVFIPNINTALELTSGLTLKIINNPWEQIAICLMRATRIFFDINLTSDTSWFNSLALEGSLLYSIPALIFSLVLIVYLIYFLLKKPIIKTGLFICLLGGFPSLFLITSDIIFGGSRSFQARYELPLYLSIQIAVAYVLAFHIFQEKTWQQKVWQFMMVGLLIAGLVSDVSLFKAESWWTQSHGKYVIKIAQLVNQSKKPLLVIKNSSINVGTILALSHRLESKVHLLPLPDDRLPTIPQDYSQIFFFYTNSSLFHQLEQDKTYSLTYSFRLPAPSAGFWRFDKL